MRNQPSRRYDPVNSRHVHSTVHAKRRTGQLPSVQMFSVAAREHAKHPQMKFGGADHSFIYLPTLLLSHSPKGVPQVLWWLFYSGQTMHPSERGARSSRCLVGRRFC